MIVKPFEKPKIIKGLEAMKKRLPVHHEKYAKIVDELSMHEAGNFGERHVLSLLSTKPLPENTLILHNVAFTTKVDVQIDVLLLTPSWCLIIEVKNIKGTLYFKTNPRQLIRINDNGTENILGMPESQIDKYCFGLKTIFQENGIQLPIYRVIHFPFNNANIKKMPETAPLLIGYELQNYIWTLPKQEKHINPKKVAQLLMKHQTETDDRFPLCTHYQIDAKSIRIGVECPHCETIPMTRIQRTWQCPSCGKNSMVAHQKALEDYYMLINKIISPREAVNFLNLSNRYVAKRILKQNSIKTTGSTHQRKYHLTLN